MEDTTSREKVLKKIRNALISKTNNPFPSLDIESSVYPDRSVACTGNRICRESGCKDPSLRQTRSGECQLYQRGLELPGVLSLSGQFDYGPLSLDARRISQ